MPRMKLNQLPSEIQRSLRKENMQGNKIVNTSKPNKFNAKKVRDLTGKIIADSTIERRFETEWVTLNLGSKKIIDFCKWETVRLTKYVKWKVDFNWYDNEYGCRVWCDVKGGRGTQDGRFTTLLQLWRQFGPGPLLIATFDYKSEKWMIKEIKVDKI